MGTLETGHFVTEWSGSNSVQHRDRFKWPNRKLLYIYYFLSHKPPPDVALPRAPRAERWKTKAWDLKSVPEAVTKTFFLRIIWEAVKWCFENSHSGLSNFEGIKSRLAPLSPSHLPFQPCIIIRKLYSETWMKNSPVGIFKSTPILPLFILVLQSLL